MQGMKKRARAAALIRLYRCTPSVIPSAARNLLFLRQRKSRSLGSARDDGVMRLRHNRMMRHDLYRRRLALSAALLPLAGLPPARANAPRTLTWEDLKPAQAPVDNPFAALPPEQLTLLGQLVRLRDREARGAELTEEQKKLRDEILRQLRAQKVPVDDLLAKRDALVERHRASSEDTVPSLNNAAVRIAGYLLPLEFDGRAVSEFLLVPYVGACVHTPPPPQNQIIWVKTAKLIEVKGNFDPVWAAGTLRVRRQDRTLFLVDGLVTVASGYTLEGAIVTPYEAPR
jgi:hypothetical protein